ncbi:hypothetical protein T02_4543, partial [Trichinella nativa]
LVARMIFYFIFTLDKRGSIIFDPQVATSTTHKTGSDSRERSELMCYLKGIAMLKTEPRRAVNSPNRNK